MVCDGCSKPFQKDDDIVVCPVCGTPQHRECYQKEGKCVNEAKHAEGFVWQAPAVEMTEEMPTESVTDTENAQTENENPVPLIINPQNAGEVDRLFMNGLEARPDEEVCDGVQVRDAAVFVQNGTGRYLKKFRKIKQKKGSWNWGAFFFAPYWFFYRKLYKIGFVFLGLMIAMTVAISPIAQAASQNSEELYRYMTSQEVLAAQKAYQDNPNDPAAEAQMEQIMAKVMPMTLSVMKGSALVLLVTFLVPNTVAALIADTQYRKKMKDTVQLANTISDGNPNTARFTLLRRGGVSFTAALASILAGMYLPNLLLMLAQALAR